MKLELKTKIGFLIIKILSYMQSARANARDLDPELRNYYVDIKQSIQKDYAEYIGKHPEIRQLMNDYMSSLLLHKPENVYKFTRDYFAFFNKDAKEPIGPKPFIVIGPSGVGKVSKI